MATYKGIKGVKVVTKATDPTASEAVGTVWYNSTSPTALKYSIESAGAWASGAPLNSTRSSMGSAGDSVLAALSQGGDPTPGLITETYDGTSWSEVGNTSNVRVEYGNSWNGTATACIMARGAPGPIISAVESWDGTSWTALTAVPTAARGSMGAGTSTAAVIAGGYYPSNVVVTTTFEYNAPSWATGGALNTGRSWGPGGGSQTAALVAGGATNGSKTGNVEEYDGTSWSEVNNLTTTRDGMGMSGAQNAQTSAVVFGGRVPAVTGKTEQWDGTSWTETGDLASARGLLGGCGASSMTALAFGGGDPKYTAAEEFSIPDATKTFTAS